MENFGMASNVEFLGPQNIECRASIRVPVRIPVILKERPTIGYLSTSYEGLRTLTHDLSFDGTFIKSNSRNLQIGAYVRIMTETATKRNLTIDAFVTRNTGYGVALMFTEYDNEVLDFLSVILAAEYNNYLDARPRSRTTASIQALQKQ